MSEAPNVIVLSADSLRLDRTMDHETMPFLAERGGESTRFTNAVANGPFTPASFPTLLASRYASSIDGIGLPEEGAVTTIAEALRREGYRTALWSDNKFVGDEYNYDRGYETGYGYETSLRDRVREHIDEDGRLFKTLEFGYMRLWKSVKNTVGDSHYYTIADDLNTKAKAWLDGLDPERDAIHLWLHYMDSHHPYEPPEAYMPYDDLAVIENRTEANNVSRRVVRSDGEDATDAERQDLVRLYDAECQYLDAALSEFVDWLEASGWLTQDDVLVITSDHGEVLSGWHDWGVFGHENVFTEECTRIPLLIQHATLDPRDIPGQVSLIDLLPTILELVEKERPSDLLMGDSLRPIVDGELPARDRIFYDGTLEYHGVRTADGRKLFNCEHLGADNWVRTNYTPDPNDYDDEPIQDGDADGPLLKYIAEMKEVCGDLAEDSKGVDPDSLQVEQHMRDLGYLE